jgi:hypothetical protein
MKEEINQIYHDEALHTAGLRVGKSLEFFNFLSFYVLLTINYSYYDTTEILVMTLLIMTILMTLNMVKLLIMTLLTLILLINDFIITAKNICVMSQLLMFKVKSS